VLTVEERQARNGDAQVDAMAKVCGLDLDARVCLAPNRRDGHHEGGGEDIVPEPICGWGTVTVREVLTRHIDFMATPRRRFFQLLPFFCPGLLRCCRLCSCPCCLCFGKRVPTMNMSVCHRGALYMSALYADLGMSHAGKGVLSRFDMHLFCSLPVALLHCVLLPSRCWHVYVMHAYMYIYIITYIYVRINIYTCVHIYVHVYMHVYVHKYREGERERYMYIYIYVYTCMYIYICIYTSIYM